MRSTDAPAETPSARRSATRRAVSERAGSARDKRRSAAPKERTRTETTLARIGPDPERPIQRVQALQTTRPPTIVETGRPTSCHRAKGEFRESERNADASTVQLAAG